MVVSIIKFIAYTLAVLLGIVLIYMLCAVLLSLITVNSDFKQTKDGVTIYLLSNGAHVDICTPVSNELFDWGEFINLNDFEPGMHNYMCVGWGDKGFYMETPTWGDLKFGTAFRALFLYSETAMHLTIRSSMPEPSEKCIALTISKEQYKKLILLIRAKFKYAEPVPLGIAEDYYPNSNDRFYDAKGSYWYYETCNVWTSSVLGKAGIKAAVWSPFAWGVLWPHR